MFLRVIVLFIALSCLALSGAIGCSAFIRMDSGDSASAVEQPGGTETGGGTQSKTVTIKGTVTVPSTE